MLADLVDADQLLPRSKSLSHRQQGASCSHLLRGVRVALTPRLSATARRWGLLGDERAARQDHAEDPHCIVTSGVKQRGGDRDSAKESIVPSLSMGTWHVLSPGTAGLRPAWLCCHQ